jgi:hypothetical protein
MSNEIKTYRVLNDKGVHEYDIYVKETKKGTSYKLFRSNSATWSDDCRNEKLLLIVNTGNKYKISHFLNKNINYNEMAELYILLSFIQEHDAIYKGSIIKVKEKHVKFI